MHKWKPNAAQKAEYARKMKEKETLPIKGTIYPIRIGCQIEFYSINIGNIVIGTVINSSYGVEKNQHTFTIEDNNGSKLLVKGRNLYPNVIKHIQGEQSKKESKFV